MLINNVSAGKKAAARAENSIILVKTSQVTLSDLHDSYSTIAQCKAIDSKNFFATTSGNVTYVTKETNVKKGNMLFAIDEDFHRSKLEHAEKNQKLAKNALEKNQKLAKKQYISQDKLDKVESDYYHAKKEYNKFLKEFKSSVIYADYDGYVGEIKHGVEAHINQQDYLFTIISDNSKYKLLFNLPIILSKNFHAPVEYSVNDRFYGKVNITDQYTSPGNIQFFAVGNINSNSKCIHNINMQVELKMNQRRGMTVPEYSVMQNQKGSYIYILTNGNNDENNDGNDTENNIVKIIYVELGTQVGDDIEVISSEISDKDYVITAGLTKLHDNAEVKVISE